VIKTLTTAATGLSAQQKNVDRIANDMANVNTDAYKKSRIEFQDLMYDTQKEAGAPLGATSQSPVGIQSGHGVKVGAAHKIFEQGGTRPTGHPYDLMIEGGGFFPVQMPNGEVAYSRNGAFHMDSSGRLQLMNGAQLLPAITIPKDAVRVDVTPQGEFIATMQSQDRVSLGQVQTIQFQNQQGLSAQGAGIYKATAASGPPVQGLPGENGLGPIAQGALEGSNVDVPKSMVDLISTQRAYEMGTKVMGVADQMMQATINIK
jgi:flagellar basal-body rod protein FlgG